MAIISLRLNERETEMVDFLSNYYERDKSSLIKYSLRELYEDIVDRELIARHEQREQEGDVSFVSAHDAISMIHP
jgi:Arc/MetJ-type ribon-helix-helix transcriptional regulator